MNSDRCGIRGDRLCSPLATTSATSLTRCGFATAPLPAVTNYLRVSISACLTDTSGEPTVSVRSNSNATRNLRLLFRLVNAGSLRSKLQSRRSHTVSHVPPTHRGSCRLHSTPSALTPPQARWAVRRCTFSTPATMATAALTSSSLRRTARRGRQTLKPQADFRDCLSLHKLCDTPLCCLLQAPCARSCFASGKPITPSFTSVTRHIVITAHRHIQPLDLIGVSASRESGAVVCVPIRERNFHAHGSDFTAQWGAALHIPRGREGARAKRASARWGVCKAPTGASPRNPQTSAAQPFCIGNPLQTGRFCSRGTQLRDDA